MAKITAPNASYNDVSASVHFCDGVGYTDNPHLVEWFKAHGYEVDESPTADLDGMKVDELKAYAEGKGIDLTGATTKADILAKLKGGQ